MADINLVTATTIMFAMPLHLVKMINGEVMVEPFNRSVLPIPTGDNSLLMLYTLLVLSILCYGGKLFNMIPAIP